MYTLGKIGGTELSTSNSEIHKSLLFIIRLAGGSLGTVSTLYVPMMGLHWLIW